MVIPLSSALILARCQFRDFFFQFVIGHAGLSAFFIQVIHPFLHGNYQIGALIQLGIPFQTGLIKNRYVARPFIAPTQELRERGVRMKLTALADVVGGKRVLMVDDSVVRGTTSKQIVRMLREAGATEVHMRSASPEVVWPCFYGIDTATQDQLISANKSVDEIRDYIGADSMAFLSIEGLRRCLPQAGYCMACFNGEYPVEIPRAFYEEKFLPGYTPNIVEPEPPSSMGARAQA